MSTQLAFISQNKTEHSRAQKIANDYSYTYSAFKSVDEFADQSESLLEVTCIIVSATETSKQEDVAGMVQVLKQLQPNSFIITVIGKKMSSENAAFVKKSGCQMVLLEEDFLTTSKCDYVCSQVIKSSYIPVKATEFSNNTKVDFTLFYIMPLNQKIVPLVPKDTILEESRLKKMQLAGELLVKREEIENFKKYVETNQIMGPAGLQSRCRAHYLHFCKGHADLVFLLNDQSEASSFQQGDKLFKYCGVLAEGLLTSLSSVGDPWEIVDTTNLGVFGTLERAPSVAAYAGVISLTSGIGEPNQVMIAALLADLGILDLPPELNQKIKNELTENLVKKLVGDDLTSYQKHPEISINLCLARKLQMDPKLRAFILCSHERVDGKGFPGKTLPERIPQEAMILQFAQMIEQRSSVTLGKQKINALEARKQVYNENLLNKGAFDIAFLEKIKE